MFLLTIFILSIIIAFIRKGSFSNLEDFELRGWVLFVLAAVLFLTVKVSFLVGLDVITQYSFIILFVGYIFLIIGTFFNLNNIWMYLLLAGALLNFSVIFLNQGQMPVLDFIADIAGMDESFFNRVGYYVVADSSIIINYLGGLLPIPLSGAFAGAVSVGTIIESIALFGLVQSALIGYYEYEDEEDEYNSKRALNKKNMQTEYQDDDSIFEFKNNENFSDDEFEFDENVSGDDSIFKINSDEDDDVFALSDGDDESIFEATEKIPVENVREIYSDDEDVEFFDYTDEKDLSEEMLDYLSKESATKEEVEFMATPTEIKEDEDITELFAEAFKEEIENQSVLEQTEFLPQIDKDGELLEEAEKGILGDELLEDDLVLAFDEDTAEEFIDINDDFNKSEENEEELLEIDIDKLSEDLFDDNFDLDFSDEDLLGLNENSVELSSDEEDNVSSKNDVELEDEFLHMFDSGDISLEENHEAEEIVNGPETEILDLGLTNNGELFDKETIEEYVTEELKFTEFIASTDVNGDAAQLDFVQMKESVVSELVIDEPEELVLKDVPTLKEDEKPEINETDMIHEIVDNSEFMDNGETESIGLNEEDEYISEKFDNSTEFIVGNDVKVDKSDELQLDYVQTEVPEESDVLTCVSENIVLEKTSENDEELEIKEMDVISDDSDNIINEDRNFNIADIYDESKVDASSVVEFESMAEDGNLFDLENEDSETDKSSHEDVEIKDIYFTTDDVKEFEEESFILEEEISDEDLNEFEDNSERSAEIAINAFENNVPKQSVNIVETKEIIDEYDDGLDYVPEYEFDDEDFEESKGDNNGLLEKGIDFIKEALSETMNITENVASPMPKIAPIPIINNISKGESISNEIISDNVDKKSEVANTIDNEDLVNERAEFIVTDSGLELDENTIDESVEEEDNKGEFIVTDNKPLDDLTEEYKNNIELDVSEKEIIEDKEPIENHQMNNYGVETSEENKIDEEDIITKIERLIDRKLGEAELKLKSDDNEEKVVSESTEEVLSIEDDSNFDDEEDFFKNESEEKAKKQQSVSTDEKINDDNEEAHQHQSLNSQYDAYQQYQQIPNPQISQQPIYGQNQFAGQQQYAQTQYVSPQQAQYGIGINSQNSYGTYVPPNMSVNNSGVYYDVYTGQYIQAVPYGTQPQTDNSVQNNYTDNESEYDEFSVDNYEEEFDYEDMRPSRSAINEVRDFLTHEKTMGAKTTSVEKNNAPSGVDVDSPFIIENGRIVENPYYKYKRSSAVVVNQNNIDSVAVTASDITTQETVENIPVDNNSNEFTEGVKNNISKNTSADKPPVDSNGNPYEKVQMKIGDVEVSFWKRENKDK